MPWNASERDEIVKALAVVCELTGADFSQPARQYFLQELGGYGAADVLPALKACARECKRKLSLADVIEKIEEKREKDKAASYWAMLSDESDLRRRALTAGIPWESGKERVREMLKNLGALPPHDPAKDAARARSLAKEHWSETDADE